jgi:LPXTG-motif cell wall-anchored protein
VKKLILAFVTIAFIGLGSATAMAQTPSDCGESTVQFPGKTEYCQSVLPAVYPVAVVPPQVLPEVLPPTPTTVAETLPPVQQLPTTGNSGMSTTLGIAALLILGGGIAAVATRRRATSSTA